MTEKQFISDLKEKISSKLYTVSKQEIMALKKLKKGFETNWTGYYSTETDFIFSLDEFNNENKICNCNFNNI